MGLVARLRHEVELLDQSLELWGARVDILEQSRVQVLLVVELCDLLLRIVIDMIVGVPVFTSQLSEKLIAGLAETRGGVLLSLGEVEGERHELLPVRGVQVHLVDDGLVLSETLLEGVFELLG